jgi:DNA polymerase sigma
VVKGFVRSLPALTPLVLVLKQFLYERGLNNPYTGGLSSYCIILMVVSFLQIYGGGAASKPSVPAIECGSEREVKQKERKTTMQKNLGVLLMDFFELYGKRFKYESTGIAVTNGGYLFVLRSSFNRIISEVTLTWKKAHTSFLQRLWWLWILWIQPTTLARVLMEFHTWKQPLKMLSTK